MCVALSKATVLAAIAVQKGETAVSAEALHVPDAPSAAAKKRPFESHEQCHSIRHRLDALEVAVRPEHRPTENIMATICLHIERKGDPSQRS